MATKEQPKAPVEVGPRIHLALAAIIQDIVAIGKDRKNEAQGFKYRGIDDIYNELHPIFSAHGVTCIPLADTIVPSSHVNDKGKTVFRSVVTVGYRFTATDGSFTEAKMFGEGSDFADKSTAKALSAAQKYLLTQTFLIPFASIEDGDLTTTADPKAELEAMDEQRRARELDRQDAELGEKRGKLEDQLRREGPPAGSTEVEEAPVPKRPDAKPAEKAPKAPRKPASTPAESETSPQPSEPAKGQKSAPARAAWMEVVNRSINLPQYKDKKVGELTEADVERLYTNWAMRKDFQDQIDADPERRELRTALIAAHEHFAKGK